MDNDKVILAILFWIFDDDGNADDMSVEGDDDARQR